MDCEVDGMIDVIRRIHRDSDNKCCRRKEERKNAVELESNCTD
jgi:hypothetical protein